MEPEAKAFKGVKGAKGIKGAKGLKEAEGVKGAKGIKGAKGTKEAEGVKEAIGIKGAKRIKARFARVPIVLTPRRNLSNVAEKIETINAPPTETSNTPIERVTLIQITEYTGEYAMILNELRDIDERMHRLLKSMTLTRVNFAAMGNERAKVQRMRVACQRITAFREVFVEIQARAAATSSLISHLRPSWEQVGTGAVGAAALEGYVVRQKQYTDLLVALRTRLAFFFQHGHPDFCGFE